MARKAKVHPSGASEGVELIKRVPRMINKIARDLSISRSAIYAWRVVPAERVVEVERSSGIPRELLRPDLFMPRDEA